MFVADENGFICAFTIQISTAESEICQIRKIDLDMRDFISAFDALTEGPDITAKFGSSLSSQNPS